MSSETIARRYGTALADVVIASGETETVKKELSEWRQLFDSSRDLRTAVSNPSISHTGKVKVLEELIARTKPTKTTANFLRVLLKNGRLSDLNEVDDRFGSVIEERSGIVSAEITSARVLPETERAAFKSNLERLTGKLVNIDFKVDPEIIGGVVTRVGSTVYDGTVRTKLENLKAELINA